MQKMSYELKETGYKKCPYCNLNYILTTAHCCKICYRTSTTARSGAKSHRKIEYSIQKLEQEKTQENKDKESLLNLLDRFEFIGFLHTTNFNNFLNIYKSGLLKSRNQLLSEGVSFEDNAEITVIEKTRELIKSKVRFYYRPITPTNISAYKLHNQKNPVLIVFNKNLIFDVDVFFCDGCAGSNLTICTKKVKEALNFNWEQIFSTGPFNIDNVILKNHRNAEFLTTSPISIKRAVKIYFKNYTDYSTACKLFKQDIRFEYNPKLFY